MSNAARHVLELFLQTPKQVVTGVTGVAVGFSGVRNWPVTPVTPQEQNSQLEDSTAPLWGEVEEERAAIAEYDGGAPRLWAEALAGLDPTHPPCDIPLMRWLRFIDDCGPFIDEGRAARAEALGWGPLDLFGCNREEPFARISQAGLVWLLEGRKLLALTVDTAAIATQSGGELTFYRRQLEAGGVLAWELEPQVDIADGHRHEREPFQRRRLPNDH